MSQAGVIDGLQFARGAQAVRGVLGTEQLPRLAQLQGETEGLAFGLRGGMRDDGKPCLWISVSGELRLVCQRCLGPLVFPLSIEAELVLTEDAREIEEAEDEVDRVLASRAMNVAQLVEDEILLAMPMVPRHDRCSVEAPAVRETNASPFSVLTELRRKPDR
jgi:DUF177 domain-containing protein